MNKFIVTCTVKSPSSTPVDVTWYQGDNHAEALAALVSAGAKDIADESMPESIRTKVVAVRMDIYHDEAEPERPMVVRARWVGGTKELTCSCGRVLAPEERESGLCRYCQ